MIFSWHERSKRMHLFHIFYFFIVRLLINLQFRQKTKKLVRCFSVHRLKTSKNEQILELGLFLHGQCASPCKWRSSIWGGGRRSRHSGLQRPSFAVASSSIIIVESCCCCIKKQPAVETIWWLWKKGWPPSAETANFSRTSHLIPGGHWQADSGIYFLFFIVESE